MSGGNAPAPTTKKVDHQANGWAISAQWGIIYIPFGTILGLYGIYLYGKIVSTGQRTGWDTISMIVLAAAVGTIWTVATYMIRRQITIPDPAKLPDPADAEMAEPGNEAKKALRIKNRAAATKRAKEAEGERESVMSQFSWAGMLVGIPLGLGAIGLAVLPVVVIMAHPVAFLVAIPVFAGIFMFAVKMEKAKTWGLIPATALVFTLIWGLAATRWDDVTRQDPRHELVKILNEKSSPEKVRKASTSVRLWADKQVGDTKTEAYTLAKNGYEKVLAISGATHRDVALAHDGLSAMAIAEMDWGAAMSHARSAVEAAPAYGTLRWNLGDLAESQGDYTTALAAYEMAARFGHNDAETRRAIERMQAAVGGGL